MQLYLLTDNEDTAVGLRLVGIDGEVVSCSAEVMTKLDGLSDNGNIGIILINTSLKSQCEKELMQFTKTHSLPLVIEIPDKNSKAHSNAISDYVRDAIGIKI